MAFILIAIGFFVIGYSAHIISFLLFLVALFIVGMGQTLLTGAINSYVTILGPHESAASRICIMGICDKLAFSGASQGVERVLSQRADAGSHPDFKGINHNDPRQEEV